MIRRLPLVVLAVVLLAGPIVQGALATKDDTRVGKYHWGRRDRGELVLELGDNLRGKWNRYLNRSVTEWERSDVVEPNVVNGSTKPSKCHENRGRVEVCNADYGDSGWLGLTRIFYDNKDHITAATVKINDYYFYPNRKYDTRQARRHTMCHELGHAFGLDHVGTSSCMNDSEEAIFDNPKPIRRDFRTLERKYDHRDTKREVTVGGRGGRVMLDGAGRSMDGGGFFDVERLPNAETGPADNHTRTVEELPGGRKVVTFVSWVE